MTFKNQLYAGITLLVCAAALLGATKLTSAGDLNPPAGPVAPTHKSLTEVEPCIAINATNTPGDADSLFKISQHGSYYLTSNITGVAAKHGIEIAVSGVTLDLNGFELQGVPGSFDGVGVVVSNLINIAVTNGSVRNWGNDGVDLGTFGVDNCRVDDVLASGNAANGISVGRGSTVSNCLATQNASNGIGVSNGCTVSDCSASFNALSGIYAGFGSTVSNCTAYNNSGAGINLNIGGGSTVANCTVRVNALDGIVCPSGCVVRGNNCTSNGSIADGANIHATGNDNRIEGNNCTGADRGIDVDGNRNRIDNNSVNSNDVGFDIDGIDNLIIRNTASSNGPNYSIVAGNSVAPRISIVGSDGWAGITNANHPFANFGY